MHQVLFNCGRGRDGEDGLLVEVVQPHVSVWNAVDASEWRGLNSDVNRGGKCLEGYLHLVANIYPVQVKFKLWHLSEDHFCSK